MTAIPFTADTLGFKTYPPAYLSPQASGKNLLIGANFASAGSGYDDKTAILSVRKIQIPSVSSAFFLENIHIIIMITLFVTSNIVAACNSIVSTIRVL